MIKVNGKPASDAKSMDGFTLVEILIASFLSMGVLVVIYFLWHYIWSSFYFSTKSSDNVYEVTRAMREMVDDLREARDADNGAYLLEVAEDNRVIFYSDIDGDGETERVRYELVGSDLTRGVVEPSGVPVGYDVGSEVEKIVAEGVGLVPGAPMLTYYNQDWPTDTVNNPLTTGQRVLNARYIEINMKVDVDSDILNTSYALSDGVFLRNAKTN